MEVIAITKYVRISPLKARDVAREIQGLPVSDAINMLNFTPKKAAALFLKTLKSAVANAEHNFDLSAETLHIKEAVANTGPVLKRIKPMARGTAAAIRKPQSHLRVIVSDAPRKEKVKRIHVSKKEAQ